MKRAYVMLPFKIILAWIRLDFFNPSYSYPYNNFLILFREIVDYIATGVKFEVHLELSPEK